MFAESFLALAALLSLQASSAPSVAPTSLRQLPVARYALPSGPMPVHKNPDSVGVEVTARSAAVMDVATGQFLFSKDLDGRYPIASMTKLMTAMVFLDTNPDMAKEVTRLEEDDGSDGKQVFLTGEHLTQQQLLESLLIGSVNEAGNVLARTSLGTEAFIAQMNKKAKELGLHQATFADPTGLSPSNRASSRDVALMLKAALGYDQIRKITSRSQVAIVGKLSKNPYQIKSTNLLLGTYLNKAPYHIIAAKTGSLPEAGFCLVQDTKSQDGGEVIAVVLGSDNHFARFQDAKVLTAWAFENYTWPTQQAGVQQVANAKK